ncbi:MAG: hypothetical protein CVT66_00970 [Actinobacteria bacterium HGW-Actinobacteria-6]|nr:MAG: hypothetical protein CVT66_00970 [Actinobacteria bacterium HGW-Actinobacteria-6]
MLRDAHSGQPDSAREHEMLRALVEGTPDAVYVKDASGRYLLFNKGASAVVGQPAEAVLGNDDTALFPADEAAAVMAGDRRVMDSGSAQTYEEVVTDAEGITRTFLSTKGPIRDADGIVTGIFGIARDITPLRDAEAAEAASALQLKNTMDAMLEGCQIINRDWRYTYLNDTAERQAHKSKAALLGKDFRTVWPGAEATDLFRAMKDCMDTGTAHRMENRFEYSEDESGWFLLDIQPVPEGIFILSTDITERRDTEDALKEALNRLRTFVESNIVGVVMASSSGAIVETNDYYLNLIGYSREEFDAGLVDWRSITPPEWLPADDRAIEEMNERGACTPYEKQYLRRDGSRVWVYLADTLLPGPDRLIAAIAIDITGRKNAEAELDLHHRHVEDLVEARTRELASANQELEMSNEELDATNEELQAANTRLEVSTGALLQLNHELLDATQAKSQFLASMSHELRTPLNSIIGFSDILYRGMVGELEEEQHKQVGMIYHSGQHLLSLINEVLDLSRIEAGAVEINMTEVDLAQTVREVAETLRPLAAERDLKLQIHVPATLNSAITDESKVRQILLNLGGNAIKFTDRGQVQISVTAAVHEFRIAVADSGRGIAEGELSHIFDEFAQIDQVDQAKSEGTGLGLTISRQYAELLGGRIEVTSTHGTGSTFTLVLPAN